MEYSIVRVDRNNYHMFDDMVFFRINERERSEQERAEARHFDMVYEVLDKPNLHVFAAQSGDRFVGWISIVHIPKISRANGRGHLFIDELWVNPACRKQGIASALMRQADALSDEIDTLGARLYVDPTNAEAVSLYERCGYGRKFGAAILMEKEWAE